MAIDMHDAHAEGRYVAGAAELAGHDRFASQRVAPASVLKFLLAVNVIAVKVPSVSRNTPRDTVSLFPRFNVFMSLSSVVIPLHPVAKVQK
jgi:hypothetical protein